MKTLGGEKEKETIEGRAKEREREQAMSISNPADCQMTRGMVLPLVAVLPSFLPFLLLFSFAVSALSACHTLRVFKIFKSAKYTNSNFRRREKKTMIHKNSRIKLSFLRKFFLGLKSRSFRIKHYFYCIYI